MSSVADNMNALHKEVFADGVPDLIPDGVKLQQKIKFVPKEQELGLKYVEAVRLAYPAGFTHALGDGTAGAFALNDALSGTVKRAEVQGSQVLLRDWMDLETAAKASRGGAKSFKEGTKFFYEGLQKAMRKRIECELFYGAQGIGTISGTPSTIHTSNKLITITTAQWAAGIWAGAEGMHIDCYNSSTQINTNADLVVVSVDPINKTVEVSGNATDLGNLASGYTLYFKGSYGAEMTGVHGILNNSGSLFNIDAGTYSLWKSTQYAPTSGALTFTKVKKAISQAVAKGLDEDVVLLVSPGAWDDMMNDIAALRRTDKSEVKKVEVGAQEIAFKSQNGNVEVVPSMYVKEGFAYGLIPSYWKRIGAADVTFKVPGFGDQMFFNLPSNAGIEGRCYSHQAVFCERPGPNFIISNIVNSLP